MPILRLVTALILVTLLTPGAAAARTPSIRCGTVVEEDAVLDRDLRCEGPALILRNPRSVLQLKGHTVESSRSCADERRRAVSSSRVPPKARRFSVPAYSVAS